MRLLIPFGTRPEIVKLAPIVRALRSADDEVTVVATGQHYDAALTEVFYDELGLHPDIALNASGVKSEGLGAIVAGALNVVNRVQPDAVLVMGDTQTVPAFCLAARNCSTPVIHLEAGLRSFNPTSIEEVNRRIAAATCSLHLAPTEQARRFLIREGVLEEHIAVVGNPVLDSLRAIGAQRRPLAERAGVVVTAHRATNVEDPGRLMQLVTLIHDLAGAIGPVTFPVHPRTRHALERAGQWHNLATDGVALTDPMPYTTMIDLVARSKLVVTDSGGLQEEAAWLGVPVVVLRRSTPRWEGVRSRIAILTGLDADRALKAAIELTYPEAQRRVAETPCPYGDGHTARQVVRLLHDPRTAALLRLEEPDFVDRPPPT
ncbi:MAG: UDP-N-acetylglucosamine 2-epimerase (non-hydrolyzing) [Pseudonocardiales bacterium]|nr:UDP-N-acetylglucosamine 2-epimerase (non-hydrolyzing) [Pseudonocardiales bacterium]MBV9729533.1 UDP-N-acetylglucosamine 2-epimerase (non-hydrolyzing) [Pseudonocardiales bacterium]